MTRPPTLMERRVAEAIVSDIGGAWQSWVATARACIRAMREPTKTMAMAGDTAMDDCVDRGYDSLSESPYTSINSDTPGIVYMAMIDAASPPDSDA